MQTSQPLHGPARTFLSTCTRCTKGKAGRCPWVNYFNEHNHAPAIVSTYATRAMANHSAAGYPCDKQITFEDLIDMQDQLFETGPKPANCRELNDLLLHFGKILYERLPLVGDPLKAVFKDAIPAAIFSLVSELDIYYLTHHYDILEIINNHFPDYNRLEVFSDYMLRYIKRASFTSCHLTMMDVDLDFVFNINEHKAQPAPTQNLPVSQQKDADFIKEHIRLIKADYTCDFITKVGNDQWKFYNERPEVYAYLGLLLYAAMGKNAVAWKTLYEIIRLDGYSLDYVKRLASNMKNGKVSFPKGCYAINNAFPEEIIEFLHRKQTEK